MARDLLRRLPNFSSANNLAFRLFAALLASYLIFVLPYSFPPHARLASPSYVFGFNNRVAIASILIVTLLLSLNNLRSVDNAVPVLVSEGHETAWRPDRRLVLIYVAAALTYLAVTLVIYFAVAKSDWYYKLDWESSHFLWRTRLMTIYGLKPYRDFVAEYGPALVYLPAWTAVFLQPFGVSTEPAYYILHYLLNVLGLAALLYVIDGFSVPLGVKRTAFVLIALSAFSEMMGLNGLLIRFILPYASLLLVHRISLKAAEQKTSWRLPFVTIAASVANISISPDIGIEWLAGVAVYAAFAFRLHGALAKQILISEAVVVAISPLVLPTAYFHTLVSFSQGANNFPIVPALHIVFYLVVFLSCIPRFLATGLLERNLAGAYAAGAGTLCLAALPAALGRCDPPHVILDGFGLFTLAFATFYQDGRRRFLTYAVGYIAVAIVAFQYSNARVYGVSASHLWSGASRIYAALERFRHEVRSKPGGQREVARAAQDPQIPQEPGYAKFDRYRSLGLPYGSYGYEKSLQRYLWSKREVAPERYMGVVGVYNEQHLAERLHDLGRIRYIVVEKHFLKLFENRDLCAELQSYFKSSFLYFTAPPCTQLGFNPDIEMARFIDEHYHVIDEIGSYLVLELKS